MEIVLLRLSKLAFILVKQSKLAVFLCKIYVVYGISGR